jgi:hypothetical protein
LHPQRVANFDATGDCQGNGPSAYHSGLPAAGRCPAATRHDASGPTIHCAHSRTSSTNERPWASHLGVVSFD